MISSMLAAVAVDREGDVLLAQRAVALAVAREIERHHRDALALDIAPDIELGPGEQRMDAQMWPPGGGSVLYWSQNSAGWSRKSQPPLASRGLKTRSLPRIACSSRLMPSMMPRNPRAAMTRFRPSVLRAAARDFGGSDGSVSSTGGQGASMIAEPHSR